MTDGAGEAATNTGFATKYGCLPLRQGTSITFTAVWKPSRPARHRAEKKWGPASLPAPTAPSEGYAGIRNLVRFNLSAQPTRSRSWLTSSGVAFHPTAPSRGGARSIYSTARPEGSLVVRPFRPVQEKPNSEELELSGQNRPMFRGPSWVDHSRVPLCPPHRNASNRVALEEDRLFRRLFPTGPGKGPKAFIIACRRRSDLCSLPHLPAVASLPVRPGPPSRSRE
jgi:hypothetical protein